MTSIITGNMFTTTHKRVLQTINTLYTTEVSQTITNADLVIGGLTRTFTSVGANSKYIIYARWFGEVSGAWDVVWNLRVNGTRVGSAGTGAGKGMTTACQSYILSDDNSTPETVTVMHSHNSSIAANTSVTIDLTAIAHSSRTIWTNRCYTTSNLGHEHGSSELIIQEIEV